MVPMERIAIIGAGASGLAAAVAASEASDAASIDIFECSDRVGRPVLATGNGRCNFTNSHIDCAQYRNPGFVSAALDAFEGAFPKGKHPNGVAAFFARRGMLYREEGEGRLYPLANKASVVLDVLRGSLGTNVNVRLDSRIESIDVPREPGGHFTLRTRDGVLHRAERVIVACGGAVAEPLLPHGIAFSQKRPVLCSLATDVTHVRELDNIRAKATLSLMRDGEVVARESGEVMFRKYGLSGICTFNLSRLAQPGDELSVDFLPFVAAGDVQAFAADRLAELAAAYPGGVDCAGFLRGMVLPRVADALLKRCRMREDASVTDELAVRMTSALKDYRAEVKGPGDVEHAQVQRGGARVEGFDPTTMESRDVPGLHVVGEALDVDGPCGGYNLHWAFASGIMAGRSCAS